MNPAARICVLLSLSMVFAGCGTMSSGKRWGADAGLAPGWARLGASAVHSVLDPQTWGPLAAAALLQIDHADEAVSDWAVRETPLFGSVKNAEDAKGWTGNALDGVFYVSLAATPSGNDPYEWVENKFRGGLVEFAAFNLADSLVDPLKSAAGRERPNQRNKKSLPSSHANRSSADVTLAVRNLEAMELSPPIHTTLKTGIYSLGVVSAWSRVEAEAHYPSDVLAGWALGHFLTAFIHDAFFQDVEISARVHVTPLPDGLEARLAWSF